MSQPTRGRFLNRFRLILDGSLTPANALDLAHKLHPDSPLFHLDAQLPYQRLSKRVITPRELLPFVNRFGNVLRNAGMQRYDRVAIFKSNAPDYFFLGLGIIKAGGVVVPINPNMEIKQLRLYLEYTGAKILVTDSIVFNRCIRSADQLPTVGRWCFADVPPGFTGSCVDINQALESVSDNLDPIPLAPDSDILIAHTSGTTGVPKGVISTSGSLIHAVKGHYKSEPVGRNNRTGVVGHYNHLVYYVGFYASLLANMPVWTLSQPDATSALEMIQRERLDFFFAFPDVYLHMYEAGLDKFDLSSVRVWVATADASHEIHMRAFTKRGAFWRFFGRRLLGSVFIDVLGTSEIGSGALRRFFFPFTIPRHDRCVGRPIPGGPKVRIADENGHPLPRGRIGRLMVKGASLFKGYWNAHHLLHNAMLNGWWWTGDLAYQDRWGAYHHLDRASDTVFSDDCAIYTLPIEEILLWHPDVSEAVVLGVPDSRKAVVPVGIVYSKPDRIINANACCGWLNAHLTGATPLKEIIVVTETEVPRGLTGKVLKRALRETYNSRYHSGERAAQDVGHQERPQTQTAGQGNIRESHLRSLKPL